MTLKSRLLGLVTILVLFAMAPGLFAQVQITIIPDIDSGDISTNNNAVPALPGTTGSGVLVVGSLIANSQLQTTVLRIAYPGPITAAPPLNTGASGIAYTSANCTSGGISSSAVYACGPAGGVPVNDPIRITGASGVFGSMTGALLNTTLQRIEVALPGFGTCTTGACSNALSGSFRLVGVRINANGLTGAQSVTASLNNSVNNYLIGSPSTGTVISSLTAGIAGTPSIGLAPGNTAIGGVLANGPPGTATIFTNRSVPRSIGSFTLTEGCASCWRSAAQNSNSGVAVDNATQIRLTFNSVPTGVTLNLSLNSGTQSSLAAAILSGASITTSANTAIITFTNTSLSSVETLEVDYTIVTPLSSTAAVTTAGAISATATMYPLGTGVDNTTFSPLTGVPTETGGYPTFTDVEVGPVTLVNIVPANTTMLMPYALYQPPFDTGIAIANTTADPFGSGTGGATPASGTLNLNFFPTTSTGGAGTPFSLTTSSTVKPGSGLSSDGTLAAGATWTVLMSQLLSAATQTGNFTGYVFIQANFLNAHGTATISDFKTFSLTANVLVLPPPATTSRGAPSGGAEQLHY